MTKGPVTTVPGVNTGRERAGSEAEPDRRLVTAAAVGLARRVALPPRAGFWLAAGILFLLFFGAAAPAPLYGVYQRDGAPGPQSVEEPCRKSSSVM
jgi:hypothetical protein